MFIEKRDMVAGFSHVSIHLGSAVRSADIRISVVTLHLEMSIPINRKLYQTQSPVV